MKLEHGGAALKIQASQDFEQKDFSIKSSAIAFQVLSSGLYQDKVAAVIRELSTNAWDGHRLRELGVKNADGTWAVAPIAGRTQLPFKVELPSQWNPVFAVRDYGVGLDHDGIMKLYTTYFGSTKSDSNDFTGALGLGSKSPFSIASSFLVISYYNGIKRTYTAMIGEDGFPTIVKLDEQATSDDNGLEVRVTVDPGQIHMFRDRAAKIYAFFDVKPNIPSLSIPQLKYKQKNKKWGIRERDGAPAGVLMGQICYPITLSALEGKVKPHIYSLLKQHSGSIDVFCDMGDIEFQASREALSYTSKTFNYFENALEDFYTSLRTEAFNKLHACKTKLEALRCVKAFDAITKEVLGDDVKAKKLTFRGKPIHWSDDMAVTGSIAAEALCNISGDLTGKDPLKPIQLTPKFKELSSYNGQTTGSRWIKEINKKNLKKIVIDYKFPLPVYVGDKQTIVYNDIAAPLYRIRENISGGYSNRRGHIFLVDKKHEDVAKMLAAIYETQYERISDWNMPVANLAQAQKIIRIFKPSAHNTPMATALTTAVSDTAILTKIKYYICAVGNANSFEEYKTKASTDTINILALNSELVSLKCAGILKDTDMLGVVSKTNEAEFKKLCPHAAHLSTLLKKFKWKDLSFERQRSMSALVYRSHNSDNRFNYDLEYLTGEYKHFLKVLIESPDKPLANWANTTLNTYQTQAEDIYSKVSRGKHPTEPLTIVELFKEMFKGDLISFDQEINKLKATEDLLVNTFPVFALLKELYYRNTSYRYYNFDDSCKQAVASIIERDLDVIKQKLSI